MDFNDYLRHCSNIQVLDGFRIFLWVAIIVSLRDLLWLSKNHCFLGEFSALQVAKYTIRGNCYLNSPPLFKFPPCFAPSWDSEISVRWRRRRKFQYLTSFCIDFPFRKRDFSIQKPKNFRLRRLRMIAFDRNMFLARRRRRKFDLQNHRKKYRLFKFPPCFAPFENKGGI